MREKVARQRRVKMRETTGPGPVSEPGIFKIQDTGSPHPTLADARATFSRLAGEGVREGYSEKPPSTTWMAPVV